MKRIVLAVALLALTSAGLLGCHASADVHGTSGTISPK